MTQFQEVARSTRRLAVLAIIGAVSVAAFARQNERQYAPVPAPIAKGVIVLFDGTKETLEKNWTKHNSTEAAAWRIADGAAVVSGGDIVSREKFTDYQIHVEFKVPYMPDKKGQARGNSGVFMQGRYE